MGDIIDFKSKKDKKQITMVQNFENEIYEIIKKYVRIGLRPGRMLEILAKQTGSFLGRFTEKHKWYPYVITWINKFSGADKKSK